jgi:hypothetical protein
METHLTHTDEKLTTDTVFLFQELPSLQTSTCLFKHCLLACLPYHSYTDVLTSPLPPPATSTLSDSKLHTLDGSTLLPNKLLNVQWANLTSPILLSNLLNSLPDMAAVVFMTVSFLLRQPSLPSASVPFVKLQLALSFLKIIVSVFPPPSNPHIQIGNPLAYLSSNI